MDKNKVTVFVAGQKLTLLSEESEKYVNDIASKVDTVINSLFTSTNMSKERCAIMAALDFCDDETKARKNLNEIKEQIKDYIDDSAKLRAENEALKEQIEKLKAEKEQLLSSKKTLVASAVVINNDPQEKEDEQKEVVEEMSAQITEEAVEEIAQTQISADDDLSFDIEEEQEIEEAPKPPQKPTVQSQPASKSEKKRHRHEHVNPFRQRHMQKKSEEKGYTPVRQYTLFDDKED